MQHFQAVERRRDDIFGGANERNKTERSTHSIPGARRSSVARDVFKGDESGAATPLLTTLKPRLSADWSLNATITLFTAMLTTFDGEKNEGLPSNH